MQKQSGGTKELRELACELEIIEAKVEETPAASPELLELAAREYEILAQLASPWRRPE